MAGNSPFFADYSITPDSEISLVNKTPNILPLMESGSHTVGRFEVGSGNPLPSGSHVQALGTDTQPVDHEYALREAKPGFEFKAESNKALTPEQIAKYTVGMCAWRRHTVDASIQAGFAA